MFWAGERDYMVQDFDQRTMIEMNERQKRLMFRADHMGSNENDILFGAFARDHLAELTEAQLDVFESLLGQNDYDLFDWVTGKRPHPDQMKSDVLDMIIAHVARGKKVS